MELLVENRDMLHFLIGVPQQSLAARKEKQYMEASKANGVYRTEANIAIIEESSRYIAQIKRNGIMVKQLGVRKRKELTADNVKERMMGEVMAGKYDWGLTHTYHKLVRA